MMMLMFLSKGTKRPRSPSPPPPQPQVYGNYTHGKYQVATYNSGVKQDRYPNPSKYLTNRICILILVSAEQNMIGILIPVGTYPTG